MIEINACGLSCPEPVVMLAKALKDKPEEAVICVDAPAACENCTRFATNAGYSVEKMTQDNKTVLTCRIKR